MERSIFLLRETDRTVTEICLDVGSTSLETFSRIFHKAWSDRHRRIVWGRGPVVALDRVQLTRPEGVRLQIAYLES